MPLLILEDVRLDFGGPPLLDGVDLTLERGERVCLIGRNGAGKSTLLALIAGRLTAEGGRVRAEDGVRIAELTQDVDADRGARVRDLVADGLGELATLLERHRELGEAGADADPAELQRVTERLDAAGGWDAAARVDRILDRLELDGEATLGSLSGGSRRRVLLGRALVAEPDVLLLDEPTNHLDVETIEWLEALLGSFPGAVLFTSHDRRFVEAVASRIVELDRGALTSHPGDWALFERRRDERLAAEASADAEFDRRLAQEEVWIRQGIKARRTRNEGRVRRLETMRRERAERRERQGAGRMGMQQAERSGRRVIEAEDVTFAWPGTDVPVVRGATTLIERGDRVGVIGRNGAGKTTLLRLLLGDLPPDSGTVTLGTRLELAWFDQHRAAVEAAGPDARVCDVVADGEDEIDVGGRRRHVIGWLGDFLFPPERARGPVSVLSGGERARLQLARLFARPSNVLVMDEPTNDLDIESLELLEERLGEYEGTVLLVSHDRAFLDRVVTSTLVLEGDGRVAEYVGGYSDWQRQRPRPAAKPAATKPAAPAPAKPRPARRKLGFREQRELAALPERIETLETTIEALQTRLADPALYRDGDGETVAGLRDELEQAEAELETAFERWTELEDAAPD
jgi:ATP-binding cassette subfamily F protein uup